MKFKARLYEINKGPNNQHSYFATIKKLECERLTFQEGDALLLKINYSIFPTVIRKLVSGKNRFMLGFTVPCNMGKNLPTKTNLKVDYLSKSLNNKKIGKPNKLELINLIPEKSIRSIPIYLFDHYKKIFVWIYGGGNKITELPKTINLSETKYDILELAGAFFCEGFKSRKSNKHRDRFSFSNADKDQIKWFVETVEKLLKIKKDEWSVQILYPSDDLILINKLKIYWSSVGLSKDKIKTIKNTRTNDKCGVCILNIYNSSLAESFYYISNKCQELSLQSKNNAIRFFRGLSRGDLGVSNIKSKTVSFSTETKENSLFFKKVCNLIGLRTSEAKFNKGCWNVCITHQNNFEKLIKFGCVTHKKRNINLKKLFLKSTKSRYVDYLEAIYHNHNTSMKAAKYMKLSDITTRFYFNKLTTDGFLTRKITPSENYGYTYKLSNKGKQKLEFYNKIKSKIF